MFDVFQIVDFKKEGREQQKLSFTDIPEYADIKHVEHRKVFGTSQTVFLERNDQECNYIEADTYHLAIFGSVFTNKKYQKEFGKEPKRLSVDEIHDFYKQFGVGIHQYIKGSYVLLLTDLEKETVDMITDRLNVLPLYYYFKDGLLAISSSMEMVKRTGFSSGKPNELALTEQMIFDFVLDTKTFYEDISQTDYATVHHFSKDGQKNERYWDVHELYHSELMDKDNALDLLSIQLKENVNLYASDSKKVLCSLTGGFDGRTNVAMLDKDPNDFLCCSYGMKGSKQIRVPENIAAGIGIHYKPIYLGDDFHKKHVPNAKKAIAFSSGTAPIIRANIPYAYKQLSEYSQTIVTGLFGSEILRPILNSGIQVNDHSERLFTTEDVRGSILQSIEELKKHNYLKAEIMDRSAEELIRYFETTYFEKYKDYNQTTRFFFFILREGLRKFFMQEIQIQRAYVTTRFPYFDDDLLDLIYQTPFAGMYNGFLKNSKVKRRHGQLLYAYIIDKYKPKLGRIELDRGYTPHDLLRPFPTNYLYLFLGVRRSKKYQAQHGNDTFNSEKWSYEMIRSTVENMEDKNTIFGAGIKDEFDSGTYKKNLLKYAHFISIVNFLN